jgi:hypothetical protein
MSLKVGGTRNLQTYFAAAITAGRIKAGNTITSVIPAGTISGNRAETFADMFYHAGLDRYFIAIMTNTITAGNEGIAFFDPEVTALGAGSVLMANDLPFVFNSGASFFHPGQLNPSTGLQRFYANRPTTPREAVEFNPATLASLGTISTDNGTFTTGASDIASPTDTFWSTGAFRGLFFEGLTDGIPGITDATGTNVYPKGLFLIHADDFRHTATYGATNIQDCFVYINVQTRRVVGVEQTVPGTVVAAPAAAQRCTEAPIAGDVFDWDCTQYVPDADATFGNPKGELIFQTAGEVPSISSSVPGDTQRVYIKRVDFNPFNVVAAPGSPTRTHGRLRLNTRVLIVVNPIFDVSGAGVMSNPGRSARVSFDPLRARFFASLWVDDADAPGSSGDDEYLGFFQNVVNPVFVGPPAARDVPRTNSVVPFDTLVSGDLGEPVNGQVVTFTLDRRSTNNETLTITGGIGTTSTVVNFPVDQFATGVTEMILIRNGTTTLVEGTNYSVAAATGVITWLTNESGNIVVASYNHRTKSATPPHGTLLSSSGQTDENGIVRVEVFYPDSSTIVGDIDLITST